MTRDEAVARIQRGLSFRRNLTDEIIASLEEARIELENGVTLPNFLLVEDAPLLLVAGTNTLSLPDGFIRQEHLEPLRYFPESTETPLFIPWKSYGDALLAYSDFSASGPKVATLRASTIRIFPDADVDYSLTWSYYKHSEALNGPDADANAWLANCPDALIGEAGLRMAEDLEDDAAMAKFNRMMNKGKRQYIFEKVAREEAGGPIVMGVNN